MSEQLQHHAQETIERQKHSGSLSGAADFLKASYITRWGIVSTAKEQSIAEHMYRVWTLVRVWGPLVQLSTLDQQIAEELALTHDLAEIRTGDCPTPFKTPFVKEKLDMLEGEIYKQIPCNERCKQFVKFADTAESVLFLKMYGLGRHAREVEGLLSDQMWKRLTESLFSNEDQQTLIQQFTKTYHDT